MADPLAASTPRLAQPLEPYRVLDPQGAVVGPLPELSDEQLRALYRWMVLARALDERALQMQRQGRLLVWAPLRGQEAEQAGLGLALGPDDQPTGPTYRAAQDRFQAILEGKAREAAERERRSDPTRITVREVLDAYLRHISKTKKAGTVEPKAVAAALRGTRFESVLGTIGFDEKGDVTGYEPFVWYVWRDGSYRLAAPAELAE